MKKIVVFMLCVCAIFTMFGCAKKANNTMQLGGEDYDSIFVRSGYYFDKASMSEAQLADMIEKVEIVEKPETLGTCTFPDLSSIQLTNNKKEEIDDAKIEAEIEKQRDSEIEYRVLKETRPAQLKDKVTIDFIGYLDGEKLEGGEAENYDLVLGSNSLIPGFEDAIVGHKAGKAFNIDITFPDDYTEELAGKPATFACAIKKIQEAVIPEFDEAFVASHTKTGITTVDEYKEEIRNRLEKRAEFMNKQNLNYQLYEKLEAESIFEPTEEALAWQFSVIMNQMKDYAKQQNLSLLDFASQNGMTLKEMYDNAKKNVAEFIKTEMLTSEMEKSNKLELFENDVKNWFVDYAEAMGFGDQLKYDDYKNYVGYDNMLNSAKQDMLLTTLSEKCMKVDPPEEQPSDMEGMPMGGDMPMDMPMG